jgi:Zn-dependent protease with chaperone function
MEIIIPIVIVIIIVMSLLLWFSDRRKYRRYSNLSWLQKSSNRFLALFMLNAVFFFSLSLLSNSVTAQDSNSLQTFIAADKLYLSGKKTAAEQLYRQVKPPFPQQAKIQSIQPFSDPEKLSPAGGVYWRNAQRGMRENLESLIFVSLEKIVEEEPGFIPGYLQLVKAFNQYEQPEKALATLEHGISLFPDSLELVIADVKQLENTEQWLEASIAARQFAIIHSNHPQASQLQEIAEQNLDHFKGELNTELIATGILGSVGGLVTGDEGSTALQIAPLLLSGESDFGAVAAEQYKQPGVLIDDPQLTEYVNKVGQKIAALMGRDEFAYEFYIIRDDAVNAFTLPGGKVFMNTGILLKMNSEAELAGLLGHEVSHAVLSHGYQRMTKAGLLSNLGAVIPAGDFLSNLINLDYGRSNERQSDILGTRVLAAAGYAADGLYNNMLLFKKEERQSSPEYLSTHPAPDTRISYLRQLIETNGYNRYAYEGVANYIQMKKRLAKLLLSE